jgi:hypothetical protein
VDEVLLSLLQISICVACLINSLLDIRDLSTRLHFPHFYSRIFAISKHSRADITPRRSLTQE